MQEVAFSSWIGKASMGLGISGKAMAFDQMFEPSVVPSRSRFAIPRHISFGRVKSKAEEERETERAGTGKAIK
jgi:hypothetical protein